MKTIFDQINEWANERSLLSIPWDKQQHSSFIEEELEELAEATTDEMEIDAFCDMIVFCTNAIKLKGYNPNIAMEETLKEISSRTGYWNPVTGKWEKFKTPEAMAKWYSADYSKAKE
jgi:hypothetical protein